MNGRRDHQLEFLRRLVASHIAIAGDVFRVGAQTWAIHGFIAVDGEVIIAEYETEKEARLVLAALGRQDDGAHPSPPRVVLEFPA